MPTTRPKRLFRAGPAARPPATPEARAVALVGAGIELLERGDAAQAERTFRAAVRLAPGLGAARSNLGAALHRLGRLDEAVAEHREAVRLAPREAMLHVNLAAALAAMLRFDEAVAELRVALAIDPGLRPALAGMGGNEWCLGRHAEALPYLDAAVQLDPDDVQTRLWRGSARFALGDPAAWDDLNCRLPAGSPPCWDGRPIDGTLLLVGTAEGYGDLFQGIRFAAEARRRVGSIVLLTYPSTVRLLTGLPGVDRVITDQDDLPAHEAWSTPLSLGGALGITPETMGGVAPYLTVDAETVGRFRAGLDSIPGLKVGVAWQGNPRHHNDRHRSFPLAELAPLAEVPGVALISCQKGHGTDQLATAPFPIETMGDAYQAGDWWPTAHVVSALDLLITPDSGIAHLAGALGVPTWIALPTPAEWRWGSKGEETPWYPSVRLFRQDRPGEWGGVFRRMACDLASLAESSLHR